MLKCEFVEIVLSLDQQTLELKKSFQGLVGIGTIKEDYYYHNNNTDS